jgi:hypothetical protein
MVFVFGKRETTDIPVEATGVSNTSLKLVICYNYNRYKDKDCKCDFSSYQMMNNLLHTNCPGDLGTLIITISC